MAFLVAPAAAALTAAAVQPLYDGLPSIIDRVWRTARVYFIVGALPPTVILGIPAYLLFRRRLAPTLINSCFLGAIVAALPWIIISLLPQPAGEASIGGRATILDGHFTAYGWLMQAQLVLLIALFGLAGGLMFWVVAAADWKPKNVRQEPQLNA